jgi:hypothetical protein
MHLAQDILGSLWVIATLVTWGGLAIALLSRLGLVHFGLFWVDPKARPRILRVSSRAGLGALGCLLLLSSLWIFGSVWSSRAYLTSIDAVVACGLWLSERFIPIGILAAISLVPTSALWLWENRMRRVARG